MENIEKKVIGKVIIGEANTREVDLFSVVQKDPYHYSQEAAGEDFDGHRTLWSFDYRPYNYLKESDLSGDEWRKGGSLSIYRDGKCVLKTFCRESDRAASMMYHSLQKCRDFDWERVVVGMKVYHAGVPSLVDSICDDGEIILRTEDGKDYEIYGHKQEEKKEGNYDDEWEDKDRVHATDERIYWWRK